MNTNVLQRPRWGHEIDFLIVMTAFYLCSAIVIPQTTFESHFVQPSFSYRIIIPIVIGMTMLLVLILPLLLMHVTLGQLTQRGTIAGWRVICPLASGFGYAYVALNIIFTWLIVHYISESIFLLVDSIVHQPPSWTSCNNSWNTIACSPLEKFGMNKTTHDPYTHVRFLRHHVYRSTSLEQFWLFRMYSIKDKFHQHILPYGPFSWELVLCSLLVWIGTGAGLCLGPKRIAKFILILLTVGVVALVIVAAYLSNHLRERDSGSLLLFPFWYVAVFISGTHILAWGPLLALASYNSPSTRSNLFSFLALLISFTLVIAHDAIYGLAGFIGSKVNRMSRYQMHRTIATHHLFNPLSGFIVLPATGVLTAFWCIHFISILGAGLLSTGETIIASVLDVVGTHTPRARRAGVLIVCSTGLLVSILSATYYSRLLACDLFYQIFHGFGMYFALAAFVVIIYNFGVSRLISFWVLIGGHPCAVPILRYLWRPIPLLLLSLTSISYFFKHGLRNIFIFIHDPTPEMKALTICEVILNLTPSLALVAVAIWNFVRSPKVAGGLFPRLRQTLRPMWGHRQMVPMRDAWTWVRMGQTNDDDPTVITDTAM